MPLQFTHFDQYQNIRYGISEQSDGSMFRSSDAKLESVNWLNRSRYLKRVGLHVDRLVHAKLVHGSDVMKVDASAAGKIPPAADGLITNEKKVGLGMTAADCFPIYFYDPVKEAIGLAHAGWRGVVRGVVKNIIDAMRSEFGTKPVDLLVGVGPGIRSCHFSIKPDILSQFPGDARETRAGSTYVDLPQIIRAQLTRSGVAINHIDDRGECTYCLKDTYFSHRRDQADPLETMLAYIELMK